MLEFTGERLVPGAVPASLFNEHFARYRFAARWAEGLSAGAAVLDSGCGAGYGAAEFPASLTVTGIDVSSAAVAYARDRFAGANTSFLQARCESLPFRDEAFAMIVAFEVIEHLEHWREMLCEARRCLTPDGVFLVSTPNRAYYAETRAEVGPNPFHVHEFALDEFRTALSEVFPHVRIWTENRTEAIAFLPAENGGSGAVEAGADGEARHAHFLLAGCGRAPITFHEPFAWLPATGNLLRERDRHIALLTAWIRDLESAQQRELASVHAGYQAQIASMKDDDAKRLEWIADLEEQIERGRAEIERGRAEIERLHGVQTAIFESRWFRLGRRLHVGPAQE